MLLEGGMLRLAFLFVAVGGTTAGAEWTGSTWLPLGGGVNGYVFAFAVQPNGDVLAGGAFGQAGGIPGANVARWDGSTYVGHRLPTAWHRAGLRPAGA